MSKVKAHLTVDAVAKGDILLQHYIGNGCADLAAGCMAEVCQPPGSVVLHVEQTFGKAYLIALRISLIEENIKKELPSRVPVPTFTPAPVAPLAGDLAAMHQARLRFTGHSIFKSKASFRCSRCGMLRSAKRFEDFLEVCKSAAVGEAPPRPAADPDSDEDASSVGQALSLTTAAPDAAQPAGEGPRHAHRAGLDDSEAESFCTEPPSDDQPPPPQEAVNQGGEDNSAGDNLVSRAKAKQLRRQAAADDRATRADNNRRREAAWDAVRNAIPPAPEPMAGRFREPGEPPEWVQGWLHLSHDAKLIGGAVVCARCGAMGTRQHGKSGLHNSCTADKGVNPTARRLLRGSHHPNVGAVWPDGLTSTDTLRRVRTMFYVNGTHKWYLRA